MFLLLCTFLLITKTCKSDTFRKLKKKNKTPDSVIVTSRYYYSLIFFTTVFFKPAKACVSCDVLATIKLHEIRLLDMEAGKQIQMLPVLNAARTGCIGRLGVEEFLVRRLLIVPESCDCCLRTRNREVAWNVTDGSQSTITFSWNMPLLVSYPNLIHTYISSSWVSDERCISSMIN